LKFLSVNNNVIATAKNGNDINNNILVIKYVQMNNGQSTNP